MPLTDSAAHQAKSKAKSYKLSDAGGLYLEIQTTGAKYWRLKYRFLGKEKRLALGVYPAVSLAKARTMADEARQRLRKGVDPSEHRKEEKRAAKRAATNAFEAIARQAMNQTEPNRHEQRRLRTKEAIIAAASEIFVKKGVADTTVADITEAADVGYGTFYNHFHSLNDVASAVGEMTIVRVVRTAQAILPEENIEEFMPAVGVRVLVRLLVREPAIRWLLEHPYVFVDEWRKAVMPFAAEFFRRAGSRALHGFEVMGGVETWFRMYPWMVVAELNDAIEKGSSGEHEENLASMSLHLLGLDSERRAIVLDASRKIVDGALLPPTRRGPRTLPK